MKTEQLRARIVALEGELDNLRNTEIPNAKAALVNAYRTGEGVDKSTAELRDRESQRDALIQALGSLDKELGELSRKENLQAREELRREAEDQVKKSMQAMGRHYSKLEGELSKVLPKGKASELRKRIAESAALAIWEHVNESASETYVSRIPAVYNVPTRDAKTGVKEGNYHA